MSEQVNARILLWGIEGAGKSTTLTTIHSKLQAASRGEIRYEPTDIDPTVHYPSLAIALGKLGGVDCRIELIAVPNGVDQEITRKQLLNDIDGIVIVLDASPDRIAANAGSISELRSQLEAYGRRIEECPIVLQYNKRDVADPFAIEDLHRKIGLQQVAVFETIATTGHGILPTLTTISKHVVRARRTQTASETSQASPEVSAPEILEAAMLLEAEEADLAETADTVGLQLEVEPLVDEMPKSADHGAALRIISAGQSHVEVDGELVVQLVVGDEEGMTRPMTLRLRLDSLSTAGSD